MKKWFIPVLALSIGCGSHEATENEDASMNENKEEVVENTQEEKEPSIEDGVFGTDFSTDEHVASIQVDSLVKDTNGVDLIVMGNITSCCQKKGCWMKMKTGEGKEMMVRFKDYGFFVPKDLGGHDVYIKGVAKRQLIPVDELKHYAEDAGKSQEEIDAITEPQEELTFLAEGVKIADK